jgi:hypothetical protein
MANRKLPLPILGLVLITLLLPAGHRAKSNLASASPVDTCVAQAFVKIEKVEYKGKDSAGNDQVYVEWRDQSTSPCVYFGGGFDTGKSQVSPFGQEVTVKIKRRFGNEDSGSTKSNTVVNGDQVITNLIKIPRDTLETDPVSFEVKVKTTAGVVMRQTARIAGTGAPALAGATQTFTHFATVQNILGTCSPSVQVPALDFIPGAGPKPDRVTLSLNTGLPPAATLCYDQPKVSVVVNVTRPNGTVDSSQANVAAGNASTTITLPGTPGAVSSFVILVTATAGSVVEKSSISTGAF